MLSAKRLPPLLQRGNSKLGEGIRSFSLPIEKSCKSATLLCSANCYAKFGHFNWESVRVSRKRAWKASRSKDFVDRIVAFCTYQGISVVRIHVSGDFSDPEYVMKWAEIARRCPKTIFFAYTRRWRSAKMAGALAALGSEKNVSLWLSADAETGEPPRLKWSAGVAYMSLSDEDLPSYKVDLVFRDRQQTVMKRTPMGGKVCPYDDGVKRKQKITCAACKFCFTPGREPVSGSRTSLPVV